MTGPVRTLVARCVDWPVVALGRPTGEPVAVVEADRVVAVSPEARRAGVVRGLRRRAATARCGDLVIGERDPEQEARAFEPLVAALGDITPWVEVSEPGTCAFAVGGPARYFGDDGAVAQLVLARLTEALGDRGGLQVGAADGPFTAAVAAQLADPLLVVAPGAGPAFLAPLAVTTLRRPHLTDVLVRLGLRTLGAFGALPPADVLARFGEEGRQAQRLAAGLDDRSLELRQPPEDWSVSADIDPPADRVDRVAFCARRLAERLHRRLDAAGLSCLRVAIAAETEHGETHRRLWRHEGGLSAQAIADRVRWQLDGWLAGPAVLRPSGGVVRLALIPDEVGPARGRQLGFWGGESEAAERAVRAVARLCGRFGSDAVQVPERRGGRHPDEQFALVPAADVDLPERRLATDDRPWPGRLPPPSPARLALAPWPAELLDAGDAPVAVSARGVPAAPPARLCFAGRQATVVAWAGPWLSEERWWDRNRRSRRARFQVLTDDGLACLVVLERGRWWVSAVWD